MVEELRTKADELLDILQEKKLMDQPAEISIPEAAKKLNITEETVEKWVEILQEQKIVKVKYKLTTPYIELIDNNKTKKYENKNVDYSHFIKTRLNELRKKDSEKEYETIKNAYLSLVDSFKTLTTTVISKKNTINDKEKYEIFNNLKRIKEETLNLKKSINKKDINQSKSLLKQISQFLNNEVKRASRILNEKEKTSIIEKNDKIEENLLKLNELDNLSDSINNANKLIESGDFEKAKELYKQIKSQEDDLPKRFLKAKEELTRNMIELNKKMTKGLARRKYEEFKSKEREIQNQLKEYSLYLNEGKLEEAKKKYKEIIDNVKTLPIGFIKNETDLENRISLLYNQMLELEKKKLQEDLNKNINHLNWAIKKIKENIKNKKYEDALKLCQVSRNTLTKIPSHFKNEIFNLNEQIDKLEEKIIPLVKRRNEKIVKEEKNKILNELNHLKSLISSKDAINAIKLYSQIDKEINEFSDFNIDLKISLQEQLLSLYGKLGQLIEQEKESHFKEMSSNIKQMIKNIVTLLKKGNIDEAQRLYNKILLLYDQLPNGFLIEKTVLRLEILSIYGELIKYYRQLNEKMLSNPLNDNLNKNLQ